MCRRAARGAYATIRWARGAGRLRGRWSRGARIHRAPAGRPGGWRRL